MEGFNFNHFNPTFCYKNGNINAVIINSVYFCSKAENKLLSKDSIYVCYLCCNFHDLSMGKPKAGDFDCHQIKELI